MSPTEFIVVKPSLLMVSCSNQIREVRRRVLQTRYQVTSLCGLAELQALSTDSAYAVLLLCHSLLPKEGEAVYEEARCRWPNIFTVAITAPFGTWAIERADVVVGSLAGPDALFEAIDGLMPEPSM